MTSPRPPRTRSTSEVSQDRLPVPQQPRRPPLQNRSYSAPSWDAYPGNRAKGHDLEGPVIEENEMAPASVDKTDYHGSSNDSSESVATAKPRLPQVNLAIVGAQGVGKSTFVQRALDLKQPPISRSSVKKMSLDGTIYLVRLLEIASHKISFDETGRIVWPKFIGEQELPVIDGILVLFDSHDPRSVAQFPRIFSALPKATIPFIVVACRCEGQIPSSRIDPATYDQARRVLGGIEVHHTYPEAPDSQKKCISNILRAIIARTADVAALQPSSIPLSHPTSSSRTSSRRPIPLQTRQHIRASSENPKSTLANPLCADPNNFRTQNRTTDSTLASNAQGSRNVRSNSQPVPPRTPPGNRLNRGETLGTSTVPEEITSHKGPYQRLQNSWRHSGGSDAFSSFLDMEDDGDDPKGSGPPSSPDIGKDKPADPGMTFDELVDRLLAPPMSKQDAKFASIFLCLYRKFATPTRLLSALLSRFENIGSAPSPLLMQHADHLRVLNILSQWVSEYPGDFAGSKIRKRLTDFIVSLEKHFVFAFAAKEMNSFLEKFVEDDDLGWAYDDDDNGSENVETFLDTSVQSSPATFVARSSDENIHNMSALDLSDENQELGSNFSNLSTASSVYRSGSISSQSFLTLLSVESAQQEAQRLELTPKYVLSKDQWKAFMDISEDEFAREITRIDWVMFSSFRPRELVRHVSVSADDRASSKGLCNVNRMIDQFNHLALFVASMVLLRDKPKHRAEALEKFMNIAMKLRQLNNYNSLGAVIAGLNGTPVFRLSQTRELVSPMVQKQFMSLVILMGTQKSHFAYRLAWDNSFAEKIPFLPLHRRDLVSAEEGNKTFIGPNNDRINWRKFEIMGEVVLGIHNSQRTPFPCYPKNEDVQRLILDTKFPGDQDELYNRSMQVEPSSGAEPPRKRFGWRRA
ncbi:rap guanine nucleotide exchange factor 5 [Histoplasma capsulatum var. duboisii H88]|uniref:Rap guanine nucleotide exchange factor 5 n=1 Tax=Ajellomyces capsulatus (strain H88) TaxID=544711 RepID=A0A8A1LX16_AJEC8|nr:rap guanine nucleotide exchange factor 5 [Histoplasma capsulatum var. duboisii H88]